MFVVSIKPKPFLINSKPQKPIRPNPNPYSLSTDKTTHHHHHLRFPPKTNPRFHLFAQTQEDNNPNGNGGGDNDDASKKGQPKIKWGELVFDPDPDNVIAVGLTGVLTWASVQVLWQLLVVSVAVFVAALKYCFIAALLVFILITLL